jgi:hypothetical protein
VHNLPAVVTQFPFTVYQPPTLTNSSETHFIRTPIPTGNVNKSIRTHHFDPFLEISHRLKLIIHFDASASSIEPLVAEFPIIITDFPPDTTADYFVQPLSPSLSSTSDSSSGVVTIVSHPPPGTIQPGGDEVACVDLDLPEYTPRYERTITNH